MSSVAVTRVSDRTEGLTLGHGLADVERGRNRISSEMVVQSLITTTMIKLDVAGRTLISAARGHHRADRARGSGDRKVVTGAVVEIDRVIAGIRVPVVDRIVIGPEQNRRNLSTGLDSAENRVARLHRQLEGGTGVPGDGVVDEAEHHDDDQHEETQNAFHGLPLLSCKERFLEQENS